MRSLSLNNPWNFTTLGWFKRNALNAIGEEEDTLERAKLTDFIEALRELNLNEVRIPLTYNDRQKNGPLRQILNAVPNASEIIKTIISKIENGDERIGPEILGLVELIVENDSLWNNVEPVNENITMKYLIAELPASARGFLVTKLARITRHFRPPLRDIALAFLGSILTFVNYMPSENEIRYIYIGMSQDTWRALSTRGSAKDIVREFRAIRNIFRQVLSVEFSLPLDIAIFYTAAKVARHLSRMSSDQIRRQIMIGNYYLEILTLSRKVKPRPSQNFITQLDTYSIIDYLIALRRIRMVKLMVNLARLLRHYKCFRDIKDLARDIASLLNDVTVRVVRFVSNNDCSEIAELTYGVRSFIAEWGDIISNVKGKKHSNIIHQRIVKGLESGLELVKC